MPFPQRVRLLFGSLSPSWRQDFPFCWSGMFILNLGSRIRIFSIPDPGSKFFPSWIPDPGSEFFPSRMLDPGSASKNLSILTKKKMVSQHSEIWSGSIPDPDSGSESWLFTYPGSRSWIPDPESRGQKGTGSLIPDPDLQHWRFLVCSDCGGSVGYWLSTGAAVFSNSFNGSALRGFYVQKRILCIFYFNIISLIFTVFKLWCPAHLFPNTPRTFTSFFKDKK